MSISTGCARPAPIPRARGASRAPRSLETCRNDPAGPHVMTDDLSELRAETEAALAAAADPRALDAVRVSVLGRNGRLTALLRDLGKTPPEQRRERGAALNALRDTLSAAIDRRRVGLEAAELDARLVAER